MSDNTQELREKFVDSQSKDLTKLHPRLMKGGVYGYEISANNLDAFLELIKSQTNQAVLEARIDAYADCASKGGTGTTVRIYAESRANGLKATLRKELTQEVQTDE